MGKNSDYKMKMPRDYWPTVDPDAVTPLINFLSPVLYTYAEPCVGSGDLLERFDEQGNLLECAWSSDIHNPNGVEKDALDLTKEDLKDCDLIITNPPFSWELLKPLLDHLPTLKPTWLLLPADFMHNKRSQPYMTKCRFILPCRRLFWILDGGLESMRGVKGKDNYCWYLFDNNYIQATPMFIPQVDYD